MLLRKVLFVALKSTMMASVLQAGRAIRSQRDIKSIVPAVWSGTQSSGLSERWAATPWH
jgi:hypothetical protein